MKREGRSLKDLRNAGLNTTGLPRNSSFNTSINHIPEDV